MTTPAEGGDTTPEPPPFSVDLTISSPAMLLSGNPLFTASTTYSCTTTRPVYVLIALFTHATNNFVVRGPGARRRNARIGPSYTIGCDDGGPPDYEDAILLCLSPGGRFESIFTFATTPKMGGVKHSDTHFMREGRTYTIELRERKCWWMYAEDMEEASTEDEKRALLIQQEYINWTPDCKLEFTAVA